jgi:hypothetical protein
LVESCIEVEAHIA